MSNDFLLKLQKEAQKQRNLNEKRIFPEFFDGATSFIGTHSWQTILVLALITAVFAELL